MVVMVKVRESQKALKVRCHWWVLSQNQMMNKTTSFQQKTVEMNQKSINSKALANLTKKLSFKKTLKKNKKVLDLQVASLKLAEKAI